MPFTCFHNKHIRKPTVHFLPLTFITNDCSLNVFRLNTSLTQNRIVWCIFSICIHSNESLNLYASPFVVIFAWQAGLSLRIWFYIQYIVPKVHEEEGLLLQGAAFGRLTNGIWSTAPPVPMNFSPWISQRASCERLQCGGNWEVVVRDSAVIIFDFTDIIPAIT